MADGYCKKDPGTQFFKKMQFFITCCYSPAIVCVFMCRAYRKKKKKLKKKAKSVKARIRADGKKEQLHEQRMVVVAQPKNLISMSSKKKKKREKDKAEMESSGNGLAGSDGSQNSDIEKSVG